MAATKASAQAPIGSQQWVQNEYDQIAQFEGQENEDFAFSARNEFDWLNEHMAEIFSHNNLNVTEIFKTPGKLRGKTPRTARKRNGLEARAPLSDVFSADVRYNGSPSRPLDTGKKLRIQSPEITKQTMHQNIEPAIRSPRPQPHDSGYHDMTEDEMEFVRKDTDAQQHLATNAAAFHNSALQEQTAESLDERRTTEGSFHSAREDVTKATPAPELPTDAVPGSFPRETPVPFEDVPSMEVVGDEDAMEIGVEEVMEPVAQMHDERGSPSSDGSTPEKPLVRKSSVNFASLPPRPPLTTKKSVGHRTSNVDTKNQHFGRSSYFGRFTGGKSLGPVRQQVENDEMDVDDAEPADHSRDATKLHSKSSTQRLHDRINLLGKAPAPRPTKSIANNSLSAAASASAQAFAHEPQQARQDQVPVALHLMEETAPTTEAATAENAEDDWTLPLLKSHEISRPALAKSRSVDVMERFAGKDSVGGEQLGFESHEAEAARQRSPVRMTAQESAQHLYAHHKSSSTTVLPSRGQDPQAPVQQKAVSISNPTFLATDSTTPVGSPSRAHIDGHLTASKSKLQSIMRSARGLFTSSAGVSAQAKLEALSPTSSRIRMGGISEVLAQEEQLYPTLFAEPSKTVALEGSAVVRKTRSSTEKDEKTREKEAKERERAESEFAKAREQERNKAKEFKEKLDSQALPKNQHVERTLESTSKPIRQSPRRQARQEESSEPVPSSESDLKADQPMAPPPRPQSQLAKPKDNRRPVKPTAKPTTKPPQVAIRVGTQRLPFTNTALSSSLQESLVPAAKQPSLNKKASNASIQTTTSTASFKSSTMSTTSSKPKSLVIAAQKKEQAEKEAQRKEEEKRERERKRAAAQEEAQRREREQRQREEAERQKERERVAAEEAKRRAQKEAAEKKRMETSRKAQPPQQLQEPKRAANDLAKSVRNESAQQRPISRTEPTNRPPSRMEDLPKASAVNRLANQTKPIKRVFDPDNDDELSRPSRPLVGQNYQQSNDKRRRTGEEEEFRRPTMQPPIRQSNMRKPQMSISHDQGFGHSTHGGSKPSFLNGNYPHAPPPAPSHATSASVHKQVGMTQAYQQSQSHPQHGPLAQPIRVGHPMDMAKYQSGKIPFAEAPNPPSTAYKTPRQAKPANIPNTNKSSPMYTNGENIHLEEIATDSEDEDSEDERERKNTLPDWVRTPDLFDQLAGQEQLNPDAVFGPIAPLNMEEMFKDKSRHHKFRNRTSSANWFGNDRLTEDDIRQDTVAREKLRQDGGWTYGLGVGQGKREG